MEQPVLAFSDTGLSLARDIRSGELVAIRAGQAEELRPACHAEHLICPIFDCDSPRLTTRRQFTNRWGTRVVDGFKHLVTPDSKTHRPETIRHLAGKAAVSQWLEASGASDVLLEHTIPEAANRRPDVCAVIDGRHVAFEVQVSPLDDLVWNARNSDLRDAGYAVVWLWAFARGHSIMARTTALRASLRPDVDVWFLDPTYPHGPRVARGWSASKVGGRHFRTHVQDTSKTVMLDWKPIAEHVPQGDGTITRQGDPEDWFQNAAYAAALQRAEQKRADKQAQQFRRPAFVRPNDLRAFEAAEAAARAELERQAACREARLRELDAVRGSTNERRHT